MVASFLPTKLLKIRIPKIWYGRFFVFGVGRRKSSKLEKPNGWLEKIHPGKLAWNPKMKVWKMTFPFQKGDVQVMSGEFSRKSVQVYGVVSELCRSWKNLRKFEFLFFQILWQSHSQRLFSERELKLHTVCICLFVSELLFLKIMELLQLQTNRKVPRNCKTSCSITLCMFTQQGF